MPPTRGVACLLPCQATRPGDGRPQERERERDDGLDGRDRTFCSRSLSLLPWFCSSAAARMAGGQPRCNGLDGDRLLPSTLLSSPSILASPIRESVFKLCVSRMFMAPRGGTPAGLHGRVGRTEAAPNSRRDSSFFNVCTPGATALAHCVGCKGLVTMGGQAKCLHEASDKDVGGHE